MKLGKCGLYSIIYVIVIEGKYNYYYAYASLMPKGKVYLGMNPSFWATFGKRQK